MSLKLTFSVSVELEHEGGRFLSRQMLAEQIATSLESASDDFWRGLSVGSSEYKVKLWQVEESGKSGPVVPVRRNVVPGFPEIRRTSE